MARCGSEFRSLLAGLFLTACVAGMAGAQGVADRGCETDPRCVAIQAFFRSHSSSLGTLAPAFLKAADENGLDWRLLPAISVVETKGRVGKRANVFGWNSGRTRFASVEAGIFHVARRFARSPIYAGHTAMGILRKYNSRHELYPPRVAAVMLRLAPHPVL